jgi:hypothetical protein
VTVDEVVVPERLTAVIAATTTWEAFPALWRELLDEVWGAVRGDARVAPGRNVMLERERPEAGGRGHVPRRLTCSARHTLRVIEIQAFRGSRRASVYRVHALTDGEFSRILTAGAQKGLRRLASLDPRRAHELDKTTAKQLADEASRLRASAALPDLDAELVAIAEVARWCARSPRQSWLRIAAA